MKKVVFGILTMGLLLLAACSLSSTPVPTFESVPAEYAGKTNPLGPDAATGGSLVFKTNCSPCHGAQGHGDGPAGAALDPAPKNLADLQGNATDDYLFWRISSGKPGTSMVAWQGILTDEQIWQTVAFIRTLK